MTPSTPEKAKIYLPSCFSYDEIQLFQLKEMASVERSLRRSHCHDLLDSLRQALGCKSFLSRRLKGPQAEHGYKHNTRAQTEVNRAEAVCQMWSEAYTASFAAYLALDPDPSDVIGLRKLEPSDLTMLSSWLEDSAYRAAGNKLSWLWKMTPIDVAGDDSPSNSRFTEKVLRWNEEGLYLRSYSFFGVCFIPPSHLAARLTWAHAMAHSQRWKEEINILQSESHRIPQSFKHEETVWLNRSGALKNSHYSERVTRGYEAYAHKQAAVYHRLSQSAQKELQSVQRKVVPVVGIIPINPFVSGRLL